MEATICSGTISAPYVSVRQLPLSTDDMAVAISFDAKETWASGIYQNSRHVQLAVRFLHGTGQAEISRLAGSAKLPFRKRRVAMSRVETVIQEWIDLALRLPSES